MALPCSLLSLLVRQSLIMKGNFVTTHSSDWLVWEPGEWKVPARGERLADTVGTAAAPVTRPPAGDCLCFELKVAFDVKAVKIGRAPENAIVLNDATVSREHVVLEQSVEGWSVRAVRPVQVGGKAIDVGGTVLLKSATPIVLGGVTLTYLSAAGFVARLKHESARLGTR